MGILSWATAALNGGTFSAGAGSAATPSISFSGDPNTGFYNASSNDTISVSIAGSQIFDFTSNGLTSPTTGGPLMRTGNGNGTLPTYSFSGDPDTGMFRSGADGIGFGTGGLDRLYVNNTNSYGALDVIGGVSAYGLWVRNNFYESWFEDMNNSNDTQSMANFFRSRNDATAPGAGFAGRINLVLEGFSDGSTPSASEFIWGWENAQTNNTTDRDGYLAITTMTNATASEKFRITSAGNVGIGTTVPGSNTKLDVNGQIRTPASSIADGAVDFVGGNTVTTTFDCGSNITLANIRRGGSYTVVVTGAGTAQCNFSTAATGDDAATVTYRFQPANGVRTVSSHTIYSLLRVGDIIYVSWITGFQ
jgi:hypothetical protein